MFHKAKILFGSFVVGLGLTAFSGSSRPAGQEAGVPAWLQVLIILAVVVIVVLLVLLLGWWLRRRSEAAPTTSLNVEAPARVARPAPPMAEAPVAKPTPPLAEAPAPAAEPAPPMADDLKIIEGIGPKIAGVLAAAGITTFAQLAVVDVSRLKEILAQARLTALADPTTWPEQASLAAAGRWAELETLQGRLEGGRRA